jgi:hypothetical protein
MYYYYDVALADQWNDLPSAVYDVIKHDDVMLSYDDVTNYGPRSYYNVAY